MAPAAARASADFYDPAAADPQGFVRGAERRLRPSGPAAPVMTLLTMLDIARVARARAPGQEAAERARLDAALAAARAAERRWSLPHVGQLGPRRAQRRLARDSRRPARRGRRPPIASTARRSKPGSRRAR